MSWVKNAAEIRRIEDRLAAPAFLQGRFLTVTYLTRPEIVKQVLPPPLEPTAEPLVSVGVATFRSSNCVGAFAGGALCVRARYKDLEGEYCLAMPMSTDVAIIFGRELFGEPKKQGKVRLERDGDVMRGQISRLGVDYITVEARLTEDLPVSGPTYTDRFHFKFMHAADGHGLEFDPILIHARFRNELKVMKRGTGRAILKRSHHDPLSEIEIVEPRAATYIEGDIYAKAQRLTTVDAQRFMPYAFQNIDDYAGEIGE